jgi:hypothetical protein
MSQKSNINHIVLSKARHDEKYKIVMLRTISLLIIDVIKGTINSIYL